MSDREPAALQTSGDAISARDRRRTRRVPVGFLAEYECNDGQGKGTVRNISLTGAWVEVADLEPVSGGEVLLRLSFFPNSLPVEVRAHVVRATAIGFAVAFVGLTARVKGVLKLAISKLAALHEDEGDSETTLLSTHL